MGHSKNLNLADNQQLSFDVCLHKNTSLAINVSLLYLVEFRLKSQTVCVRVFIYLYKKPQGTS